MIRRYTTTAAIAVVLLTAAPAFAQTTPTASPSPIAGFSAHGTLSVEASIPNAPAPLGLSAEIAVMTKARRFRIDLLKFASTMPNKSGSDDIVSHFLPSGTLSVVVDQETRTLTMWSEQKHAYYQSKTTRASRSKTAPKPKEPPATESTVDQIMKALRSVTGYDSFNESLSLVGHQPVNGHTSSVYHLAIQSQKHGGKLQDISSDMAFADDLSGIPVRMWLTSKGQYEGNVKLDLLSASITAPDPSVFRVPAGYKKVTSIMQLFGPGP